MTRLYGIPYNDVDGLEYWNGNLVMAVRVDEAGSADSPDSIVVYDLSGNVVHPAFAIEGSAMPDDIDGLAVHPSTNVVYAVVNNGNTGNDSLLTVNPAAGTYGYLSAISVSDVESITFDPSGQMYLTRGRSPSIIYRLNPTTGQASNSVTLTGSDVEGINCGVEVLLPIELLYFNARQTTQEQEVILEWETAWEFNNERFEIERMVSGQDTFEGVAQIVSKGTSSSYVHRDILPPHISDAHYRLKQIDVDGSHSYSAIKWIKLSSLATPNATFFPNPVQDMLTISSSGAVQQVRIFNQLGEDLGLSLNLSKGRAKVDLAVLTPGIYILSNATYLGKDG